jgi:hypothetical protein
LRVNYSTCIRFWAVSMSLQKFRLLGRLEDLHAFQFFESTQTIWALCGPTSQGVGIAISILDQIRSDYNYGRIAFANV